GPPPPPVLAFQVSLAPNGIRLAWEPVPGAGTAVYRAVPGEPFPFQPLAILPAGASSYLDQSVGRGERVVYQIRGVAGEGTEQRFSRASEPQQVTRTDTFPPAVPQGLVALARPGGVDLFWTAGEDEDLAGYRVYRRRPPEETWTRLTEDLVPAATWTDTTVQPGQLYAYAVPALDASTPANASARRAEQQVLVPGGGGRPPEDGQSDSQGAP
ncbi:MAG: fibronectin type III domain-containing protein, partial [Acidobacteriota bacterium]